MYDAKWGFRKLTTANYPVLGAKTSASPQNVNIELKNFEQVGVLSRLMVRVVGDIVITDTTVPDPGTATGRDNPEALLFVMNMKTTPDLGLNVINNMSARGILRQQLFERGYLIKAAAVPDVAATVPVDFTYDINFRNPLAVKPVEFALPLSFFSSVQLQLQFAGREQLFSGGTEKWDLSGLTIEIWADLDQGIAGVFHMTSFDERSFNPITSTQSDFQLLNIPVGYLYTSMLLRSERDNALVEDILRSWTIQGGGRIWTPQGDINAKEIQRWNRDTNISDPNVDQTGLYFINAIRDGMLTNAIDSLDSQLDLKADVLSGAGSQFLTLVSKRTIPNALSLSPVVAAGAAGTTGAVAAAAAATAGGR
jgi:hypothetical protein